MNIIPLNTTSPQISRGFFWTNKAITPFKKVIRRKYSTITEAGVCYILYPINHPITNLETAKHP